MIREQEHRNEKTSGAGKNFEGKETCSRRTGRGFGAREGQNSSFRAPCEPTAYRSSRVAAQPVLQVRDTSSRGCSCPGCEKRKGKKRGESERLEFAAAEMLSKPVGRRWKQIVS